MKSKKIFLLFAAFIFAAVAGYNIHMAQSNQNSDISLADIEVMAQAEGETPPHSGTYECKDVENYVEEYTWWYRFRNRICEAPACGRFYYSHIWPPTGECTVYYNF